MEVVTTCSHIVFNDETWLYVFVCRGFSDLDYWCCEILASSCIGPLHFLAGFFSSVDFLSMSMPRILCLNLEGAAGPGLVLCYHALCWS